MIFHAFNRLIPRSVPNIVTVVVAGIGSMKKLLFDIIVHISVVWRDTELIDYM